MARIRVPAASTPVFKATAKGEYRQRYRVQRREIHSPQPGKWVDFGFFEAPDVPEMGASQGLTELEILGYWLDTAADPKNWVQSDEQVEEVDDGHFVRFDDGLGDKDFNDLVVKVTRV